MLMKPTLINKIEDIFGDGIAEISLYDFSRGNITEESRIYHITTVASICYANDSIVGKESLYNRLAAEAAGLPSSSFEFIPVLLNLDRVSMIQDVYNHTDSGIPRILKYGEVIKEGYLLTNYRALLYDYERLKAAGIDMPEILEFYNTEEECVVIKKYAYTFLTKMDISTSKQYNRHRVNLQELSRRYVSGKKVNFELYHEQSMLTKIGPDLSAEVLEHGLASIDLYNKLIEKGVKPQSARRVIPQSMYTTIWGGFNLEQVNNFLQLRLDEHAQWEIRQIAIAMDKLLPAVNAIDIYKK
jgi:thymidylate synthase (FAD)